MSHTGNVSDHFSWEEVEHSQTASRNGIDNSVPQSMELTIHATAQKLERIRALLSQPMSIDSWYRCPALQALPEFYNPTSQHPLGEAIDFICPAFGSPVVIAHKILAFKDLIPFDQLIMEHTWVHISFSTADPSRQPRGQVLSLLSNKKYAEGITDVQGNPI